MSESINISINDKNKVVVDLSEYNKMRDELLALREFKKDSHYVYLETDGRRSANKYHTNDESFLEKIKTEIQDKIDFSVKRYVEDVEKEKTGEMNPHYVYANVKKSKSDTLFDCFKRMFTIK